MDEPVVDGVVLAAGRSARMGSPKPLLEVDGSSFLERTIRTLREGGCRSVVAVLNEAADWAQRLADTTGAAVVVNGDPDSEQIDSLRLALKHVRDDAAGIAILPVDFPRVQPETVRAVVRAFRDEPQRSAVLPEYDGVPGHPVVLGRRLFAALQRRDLPDGVRTLLAEIAEETLRVAVADAGILADVDTPEDYRRYVEDSP